MATNATPAPSNKKVASKKVFNLDTFTKEVVTAEYEVNPAATVADLQHVDSQTLLAYYNVGLQRDALKKAKAGIAGASSGFVMKFVGAFRLIPPYSEIKSRQEQTNAILTMIKGNPVMFDGLKSAALADSSSESDSDDDDEKDEE